MAQRLQPLCNTEAVFGSAKQTGLFDCSLVTVVKDSENLGGAPTLVCALVSARYERQTFILAGADEWKWDLGM